MNRLTIRARLTLLYGGLLLSAGIVLIAVTYMLVAEQLPTFLDFPRALPDSSSDGPEAVAQREEIRAFLANVQHDIRDSVLECLLTEGVIALLLVTAAAVWLGWLLAGRALQPLHQITGTARRIASAGTAGRGLHERIDLTGPRDEVKELADTFDVMLERLDCSFDGQRRFVANASHELRTPLAINRSLVELAITRADASDDVKRLGEALLAVNERHERLIDGLLTLADSETDVSERVAVDLAEVARHVVDQTATELMITCDLAAAPTVGDPVLLERLTQNLVENAIRHNVAGGWLHVGTSSPDGSSQLMVSNSGRLVPAYDVETMFQPFRRLRGERTGRGRGFGLGMSIVRAITRAHGGQVVAVPREGGGLVVTVTLPHHVNLSAPPAPVAADTAVAGPPRQNHRAQEAAPASRSGSR